MIAQRYREEEWPDDPALNDFLTQAVEDGDAATLAALREALVGIDTKAAVCYGDFVVEAIALIPGAIRTLVQATPDEYFAPRHARTHPDAPARRLGARLSHGQPFGMLGDALFLAEAGPRWQSVLACWIQDDVARGKDLTSVPGLAAVWATLDHPLTRLPLRPFPLEAISTTRPQRFSATSAGGWGGPSLWIANAPTLPDGGAPPTATPFRLSPAMYN
ncbi:MAG: DUF6183 family protein, partial [Myxococcota bacterium]